MEEYKMTFYWTPVGQIAHRRMIDRMLQNAGLDVEATTEVLFPVDVKAENDGFEITALLPGVKAEDLDIQVINETVTIQGELKVAREEKDSYVLRERPSGKFSRTLNLSTTLDPNLAEAHMDNGVLTLRVPKAETARPKMIKVTTSNN